MAPGKVAMIQQHMMMSGMTPGMPPGAVRREDAFLAFPQLYHQAAAGQFIILRHVASGGGTIGGSLNGTIGTCLLIVLAFPAQKK